MLNRASFASVLALSTAVFMPPAVAQLNATFVGDQTGVCVSSTTGFDANLALKGPASIGSSMSAAVVSFYPDGTGVSMVRTLGIQHGATGPGATPATQSTATCPFTYTVDAYGNVQSTFGTCSGLALSGPAAGQTSEISGTFSQYMLLEGGNKLVRVSTGPRVETFHNLVTGFTNQRICYRDGVFYLRNPARPS